MRFFKIPLLQIYYVNKVVTQNCDSLSKVTTKESQQNI